MIDNPKTKQDQNDQDMDQSTGISDQGSAGGQASQDIGSTDSGQADSSLTKDENMTQE